MSIERQGLVRGIAGAVAGIALAASAASCGGPEIPLKASVTPEQVSAKATAVRDKAHSRGEVRALLGEPWTENDRWAFELYRISGRQRHIELILVPPLPIPTPSEEVNGYIAVVYAPDGSVSAATFAYQTSAFEPVELRAGEFILRVPSRDARRATLSVSQDRFLREYTPAGSNRCLVMLGCTGPLCRPQLSVDGARDLAVGDEDERSQALVPVLLEGGIRRLRLTERGDARAIEAQLNCTGGAVLYAVESSAMGRESTSGSSLDAHPVSTPATSGRLDISSSEPELLSERPVIVYSHGFWLSGPQTAY